MPGDVFERRPATVHLVTGEFPPQFGGVSEYTAAVAAGLAGSFPITLLSPAGQRDDGDAATPLRPTDAAGGV